MPGKTYLPKVSCIRKRLPHKNYLDCKFGLLVVTIGFNRRLISSNRDQPLIVVGYLLSEKEIELEPPKTNEGASLKTTER